MPTEIVKGLTVETVGDILDRKSEEKMTKAEPANPLAKLREPFPHNQISKLPKPTKAQTEAVKADFKKGIRCTVCGAWHAPDVVHLDYVGHAALTDRLLDTDIAWSWEPVALTAEGLPAFDRTGGLWIKLTVHGVTRLGYGAADGKTGGDAVKEIIGDALRNAGMRFGAALDLWHKGDLHVDDPDNAPANSTAATKINADECAELRRLLGECGASEAAFCDYLKCGTLPELDQSRFGQAVDALNDRIAKEKKKNPQSSDVLADDIRY